MYNLDWIFFLINTLNTHLHHNSLLCVLPVFVDNEENQKLAIVECLQSSEDLVFPFFFFLSAFTVTALTKRKINK